MGAIAEGGIKVLSEGLIRDLEIPRPLVEQVSARERLELERRDTLYRGSRHPAMVRDRTVILVDDGLATGSTMHAAVQALRQQNAARIIVAAPVGAKDTCARLGRLADEVVCLATPEPFDAVGLWYDDFRQTATMMYGACSPLPPGRRRRRRARRLARSDRSRSCASTRGRSRATRRSTMRSSTASAMRVSCCWGGDPRHARVLSGTRVHHAAPDRGEGLYRRRRGGRLAGRLPHQPLRPRGRHRRRHRAGA